MDWQNSVMIGGVMVGAIMIGIAVSPSVRVSQNVSHNSSAPTPSVTPSLSVESKLSPNQAVRDYYSLINSQDYERGWNKLSSQLRNNQKFHPHGYKDYTDWWTQVSYVDLLGVTLVNQGSDNATVDAKLQYRIKRSGKIINQVLRYYFVWDEVQKFWLIDKIDRLSLG